MSVPSAQSKSLAELLVGPAASGKTMRAVKRAFDLARAGERVIVLTLPTQRDQWLQRLAALGPSVGVEVTNMQNVLYRTLDRLQSNRPIVLNPGRVALTAQLLEERLGRAVLPGEARLFARAVAEHKRNVCVPFGSHDPHQDTVVAVFAAYQASLEAGGLQDLDDVRLRATRLLQENPLPLGAHLVVDGYRSLNRSELEALRVLAQNAKSLLLTLPMPDQDHEAWAYPCDAAQLEGIKSALSARLVRLEARPKTRLAQWVRLEYPNPVEEARGVLRSIKALLQDGVVAQNIAVLVSDAARIKVLESLAQEYALPLAPESLGGPFDTPDGPLLEAVLLAPSRDYPLRDVRLLTRLEPALLSLVRTLEQSNVMGGIVALTRLANPTEHAALLRLRATLEPAIVTPSDLVLWFDALLQDFFAGASWQDAARLAVAEASQHWVQKDAQISATWLQAVLQDLTLSHPEAGRGVVLLTPNEASGRRFAHVFVLGAVDGAYNTNQAEDFFWPEEQRVLPEETFASRNGLPRRFTGHEDAVFFDACTRADDCTTVSLARSTRGAALRPHPRLAWFAVGAATATTQAKRTASLLELAFTGDAVQHEDQTWQVAPQTIGDARSLERFVPCHLRGFAENSWPMVSPQGGLLGSDWLRGLRRKTRGVQLRSAQPSSAQPSDASPNGVVTGDANAQKLGPALQRALQENTSLPLDNMPDDVTWGYSAKVDGVAYTLDGLRARRDSKDKLRQVDVFFVLDGTTDAYQAVSSSGRSKEWWFAAAMLARGVHVEFWWWNTQDPAKRAVDLRAPFAQKRLAKTSEELALVQQHLQTGVVVATPGFHCHGCAFHDLCRVAS